VTLALAVLSGLLLVFSFPKFGHPAFAWIALAPLITAAALGPSGPAPLRRRPFVLGVVAGLIYFGGTLYWVTGVMTVYGGLSSSLSVLIAALLAGYLALYPGVFAVLVSMAVRRSGVAGVWLAPLFWVATEWVRSWLLAGFPWALLGSSQATTIPVVQLASVTGVYGLSALVALVGTAAAAVAIGRRSTHWRGAIAVGILLAIIAGLGTFRVARGTLVTSGEVLRVGLIQGNIQQDEKWNPAFRDSILQRYITLSRQALGAGARLIIWPESSTPFYFDAEAALAEPVRRLAAESRTPFLIGSDEIVPAGNGKPEHAYNAVVLVGPDGRSQGTYRKMNLVPFGEYVPLKKVLFFVGPVIEAVSDFSAGTEATALDFGGHKVSVSVCYESIMPWLSRAFVANGSELLATITNDAWFGTSSAASQHFEQGAIRAVEEGRYVVRAANTGVSGAVDPYGHVVARSRLFEPVVLTVDVRLHSGRTIYSRIGDLIAWVSAGVTVLFLFVARPPRRRV
jgi:apolipoprotein N-acyltransferase